jgi:serine protease Do
MMRGANFLFIFTCLLSSFFFYVADAMAQGVDEVVFRDYYRYETTFLQLLKEVQKVHPYTSMGVLKKEATSIKESTVVKVNTLPRNKKKLSSREIARRGKESLLMICKYSSDGNAFEKVLIGASAIVLSEDGVCATNYHVLEPMIDASLRLNRTDSIMFVATESGKIYPITSILTYNKEGDLALFKIDPTRDKLTPVAIGNDAPVGSTVHALTNPYEFLYYYAQGVVSRNVATDINDPFGNRMEITADYAKGSSGGAILDDTESLVGMASYTYSLYYNEQAQTGLQMVIKKAIPVSSLLRVIKR